MFLTIGQYNNVPEDQRAALRNNYPDDAQIEALTSMLAPPRGYNGGIQQSLLQAFRLPVKQQAFFWPVKEDLAEKDGGALG